MPTARRAARPIGVWVVVIVSALMAHRVSVVQYMFDPRLFPTPAFWQVAFVGDVFIGLTAPIVALLLWKQHGLAVWTLAIVWQVVGIKDYLTGWQLFRIEPFDPALGQLPLGFFVVGSSLHLLNIYLLSRYRGHYLGQPSAVRRRDKSA